MVIPHRPCLEIDPEQNHTFGDHYVEVDYDLSDVMFLATSNSFNIPGPLLDRMETIRLSGYTEDEKLSIATKYLLPKQIKSNGLRTGEIAVTEEALRDVFVTTRVKRVCARSSAIFQKFAVKRSK